MQPAQNTLLKKLLLQGKSGARLWKAWLALCVGTLLLLLAIGLWWNFRQVLYGNASDDSLGSSFLTVSKTVTDKNMAGFHTAFSPEEIAELRHAPQVQDAGDLTPAAFKVNASLGSASIGFSTLLFLEAADDRFMDQKPDGWQNWHEGSNRVPIIMSHDFINMYNYVFAPSQGLPQLSENSIKALGFTLEMGDGALKEQYIGQVIGFSDRISSVLVPQSFMTYANKRFAPNVQVAPSRIIIKVGDPSNDQLDAFLKAHSYTTNAQQMLMNKLRGIIQVVIGALGVLAVLLLAVSLMVFVLFIELTIAKAQQSVQLLQELGYSPKVLGNFMYGRFVPVLLSAMLIAVITAAAAQIGMAVGGKELHLTLSYIPGWPVWAAAGACVVLLLLQVRGAVGKALRRL